MALLPPRADVAVATGRVFAERPCTVGSSVGRSARSEWLGRGIAKERDVWQSSGEYTLC
jgi:hypothetical protein